MDQWSKTTSQQGRDCNTENFVPVVVPGMSSSSSASSSTSRTPMPVPVSKLVHDRSWKPEEIQASKIPKPNKKETAIERGNPCGDSDIPEWLQEFRENLVVDEVLFQEPSHASSSHEASLEPTTKDSVQTHFPEDRNCHICKWTKITTAPCRRRNGEVAPRAVNFGDLIRSLATIAWCRI